MAETRRTTNEEARRVGDEIGVDWSRFSLEKFRFGMDVEFEHGSHDPQTDVTGDDPIVTGKIALAHMKEFPDYYERLEKMEREAVITAASLVRDYANKGRYCSVCVKVTDETGRLMVTAATTVKLERH